MPPRAFLVFSQRHPAQLFTDKQEGGAKGTILKTTCAFALGLMKEALHMQTRI